MLSPCAADSLHRRETDVGSERIRELERHREALENAIEEIRASVYEPKVTLHHARHPGG
jgi:hypothetical protein